LLQDLVAREVLVEDLLLTELPPQLMTGSHRRHLRRMRSLHLPLLFLFLHLPALALAARQDVLPQMARRCEQAVGRRDFCRILATKPLL